MRVSTARQATQLGLFYHPAEQKVTPSLGENSISKRYTVDGLRQTIISGNEKELLDYLENAHHLLFESPQQGEKLLMLALKSKPEIANAILKKLTEIVSRDDTTRTKVMDLLTITNENGWTPLHQAAQYASYETISKLVDIMGDKQAHTCANKISNDGRSVLDIVTCNDFPKQKEIKKLIKKVTLEKTNSDLTTPILFSEMLQNPMVDQSNEALLKNIHYGCIVASHVRQFVSQSSTHPNCNSLDKPGFAAIIALVKQFRNEYGNFNKQLKTQGDAYFYSSFEYIANNIKRYKLGNCGEVSDVVAYLLAKLDIGLNNSAELFSIENGDHTFVVVGRDQGAQPTDFKNWGVNAVVVDAWRGEVYPAIELASKLKVHQNYINKNNDPRANLIFDFNRRYHKLHRIMGWSPSFLQQHARDLSEFSKQEKQQIAENEQLIANKLNKK